MAKKPSSNPSSAKAPAKKAVVTLTHEDAKRKNIPTAEYQPVMAKELQSPIRVAYERRNRDLDPQLVWRGKDEQDWSDLVVPAPPLFIQEKVHPKALIDDLRRRTEAAELAKRIAEGKNQPIEDQLDLFADFNGLPDTDAKTEFYQHDAHWANRMILGDSLQVMASLAEREGLRGQVQCIYFDPPYGIKFNSNFQWSTTSRTVVDGNEQHITREPEQVRAFRDTWRDGIHSYLTYLRDRVTVARDLLAEAGSLFVQIGDENVHRIRAVMDEVFGDRNLCAQITVVKTAGQSSELIAGTADYVLWYAKNIDAVKFRNPLMEKGLDTDRAGVYRWIMEADGTFRPLDEQERSKGRIDRVCRFDNITSQRPPGSTPVTVDGRVFGPGKGFWKTGELGMNRLGRSRRLRPASNSLTYVRFISDFPAQAVGNVWLDTATGSFTDAKIYVVQSGTKLVQRCVLMASDPGDLVLDPTCGSGTTAFVSEQWGRRWITIDTSRVALALARARIMGARYPYYLKADSREGQLKEAEITRTAPSTAPVNNSLRQGFVYERVPHITLKSIANNAEIDVIWEKFQQRLEPLRAALNKALGKAWEEWEIPREDGDPWPTKDAGLFRTLRLEIDRGDDGDPAKIRKALDALNQNLKRSYTVKTLPDRPVDPWPGATTKLHREWWKERIARQKEIDGSIAAKAEYEYLYDKPYEDKKKVRVAGPFTVESLSPHRTLGVDETDELIDPAAAKDNTDSGRDFAEMILETLKAGGVQQAHKEDRITFSSIAPWPGRFICAEGRYVEGEAGASTKEKRAAILIGPEFGTVSRQDLVVAAREAGDSDFDVLIACAFNYEAHASEFNKLGRIPVLKARMNAELHMGNQLKNTGKGNLFVIFGEPDIEILAPEDAPKGAKVEDFDFIRVKINGVDVFHPQTGEVRSDGAAGIACWFIDTDYNEESFFVRHAYFLGANDPYKALKTTLKAEINEEAWETLHSDTSRPFPKPAGGKIAVKVINHLGDEVMKVFRVE